MRIAIYGAQGIALGTYEAIKVVEPENTVECFVVTKYGLNASVLGGLGVLELDDFVEKYLAEGVLNEIKILIATPESVMDEIEDILLDRGINNFERVTSMRYSDLWREYQTKKGKFIPVSLCPIKNKIESECRVQIFMARFCKDVSLLHEIEHKDYYCEIQVGAIYSDVRVKSLWNDSEIMTDDIGDNISGKNCNYSELTALYWCWKNILIDSISRQENYYGICHYRRQLDFSSGELNKLGMKDIDVVLPFPMPYEPDINVHHERYLHKDDWDAVLKALEEVSPEYYSCVGEVLSQRYLYNYNLILAKRDVLREYCEWLFPILARVEELSVPPAKERQDRYIGYVAEIMETLYFMKNRDNLKIAHTGCIFRL